jgi:hypothetical protein
MKSLWRDPEYRQKMVLAHKGKILSAEHRANIAKSLTGRIVSDETKNKISLANKEVYKNGIHKNTIDGFKKYKEDHPEFRPHKGFKHSDETKLKIASKKIGTKLSEETKLKISLSHRGEKAYQWKGGTFDYRRENYVPHKYREWRKNVFERDGYTCQKCYKFKVYLNAHHIKPWAKFPQLCYDVDNGLTLCEPCHRQMHKKLRKANMSTGG